MNLIICCENTNKLLDAIKFKHLREAPLKLRVVFTSN